MCTSAWGIFKSIPSNLFRDQIILYQLIYISKICFRSQCQFIDGKKIAEDIQKELRASVDEWVLEGHRPPCLIAVLVGEDPASHKYVQNKMLASQKVGEYLHIC